MIKHNLIKSLICISVFLFFFSMQPYAQGKTFELRGVWVSTIINLDYPSKKGLPVEQQKKEFIQLLDSCQSIGINAIFFQVRPSADAFYHSTIEPWSEYLTRVQGMPPSPFYDPLLFMIQETHKRGMAFHAWINPYRAVFDVKHSSISKYSVIYKHPSWFFVYGSKEYFNPGIPQVQDYILSVVKDLVSRYDIDGIHLDDYFYPYPIPGMAIPDRNTFLLYGHHQNINDWRRSNCDSIVARMGRLVRQIKPYLIFGISPFGIWRNKIQDAQMGSNTNGLSSYDQLYANSLLWLEKGWIDYIAPQLYWDRHFGKANYDTLLNWWNHHTFGRQLYIGLAAYKTTEKNATTTWRDPSEIPLEIKDLQLYNSTNGCIFFSVRSLMQNVNGLVDSLKNKFLSCPAIIPSVPWLKQIIPSPPMVKHVHSNIITVCVSDPETVRNIAVFISQVTGEKKLIQYVPLAGQSTIKIPIPLSWKDYLSNIFVVSVSRTEKLSEPVAVID